MFIRTGAAAAAVLLFGSFPAVLADGDHGKSAHRHRHARVLYAEPVAPPAGFPGGRLVTHPAWTFACEGAYGPNRGPACDIPIWVYGSPCEVGIGWQRSRPCDGR
jgi:hypothetical protein